MTHRSMLMRTAPAVIALVLAGCAQTRGEWPETFTATLAGAQEVPPVASSATGDAEIDFRPALGVVRWRIRHAGLSAPVPGAHIHAPAGPGQNAAVVIPFGNLQANPITGESRITPEQLGQLNSGQWYVNVHTARHPDGEIRGQWRPRR